MIRAFNEDRSNERGSSNMRPVSYIGHTFKLSWGYMFLLLPLLLRWIASLHSLSRLQLLLSLASLLILLSSETCQLRWLLMEHKEAVVIAASILTAVSSSYRISRNRKIVTNRSKEVESNYCYSTE